MLFTEPATFQEAAMKAHGRMLIAGATLLLTAGCADAPAGDGEDEVLTALELARAGLQRAHDGVLRFECGDRGALVLVEQGIGRMAEGLDDMERAFDAMATVYIAGGEPVYGIGENSRCGTVQGVMGPMRFAWARMDGALDDLTDRDLSNDAGACSDFHAGHVTMAECFQHAIEVVACSAR